MAASAYRLLGKRAVMMRNLSIAERTVRLPRTRRKTGRRQRLLIAASLVATAALSAAALAATSVTVQLEGEIGRECAILGGGAASKGGSSLDTSVDVGDITRPGHKDIAFTVHCNTPFKYRLEAQYGALTHKNAQAAPRGFLGAVPYDVTVHIPTDGVAIDDHCSGDSIRAGAVRCPFSNSGNGIALGTAGQLTVAWIPDGLPMAGEYSDRLTITVSARQ